MLTLDHKIAVLSALSADIFNLGKDVSNALDSLAVFVALEQSAVNDACIESSRLYLDRMKHQLERAEGAYQAVLGIAHVG